MAKHIHIWVHDAAPFDESKVKRDEGGRFATQAASHASKANKHKAAWESKGAEHPESEHHMISYSHHRGAAEEFGKAAKAHAAGNHEQAQHNATRGAMYAKEAEQAEAKLPKVLPQRISRGAGPGPSKAAVPKFNPRAEGPAPAPEGNRTGPTGFPSLGTGPTPGGNKPTKPARPMLGGPKSKAAMDQMDAAHAKGDWRAVEGVDTGIGTHPMVANYKKQLLEHLGLGGPNDPARAGSLGYPPAKKSTPLPDKLASGLLKQAVTKPAAVEKGLKPIPSKMDVFGAPIETYHGYATKAISHPYGANTVHQVSGKGLVPGKALQVHYQGQPIGTVQSSGGYKDGPKINGAGVVAWRKDVMKHTASLHGDTGSNIGYHDSQAEALRALVRRHKDKLALGK